MTVGKGLGIIGTSSIVVAAMHFGCLKIGVAALILTWIVAVTD
jgi:hypothetical protein